MSSPFNDSAAVVLNRRSRSQNLGEWAGILVAAIVIAMLLRTFVMQTFYIPSGSMENTLLINDRLIVNKLSYKYGDLSYGDIIVFDRPPNLADDPSINELIKRVIGLPGDTIEVSGEGEIKRNGQVLQEDFVKEQRAPQRAQDPVTIGDGQVWVMGDNRANSEDSRYFGAISQDLIVGKAVVRVLPFSRIGLLTD